MFVLAYQLCTGGPAGHYRTCMCVTSTGLPPTSLESKLDRLGSWELDRVLRSEMCPPATENAQRPVHALTWQAFAASH